MAAVTNPRAMRVSVKGDILSIDGPAKTWTSNFEQFPKFEVRHALHDCPRMSC